MRSLCCTQSKRCALLWRGCLLATLLISSVFVPKASATHFRFGTLNWQPTATQGEVLFQLNNAFRRNGYSGTASDGFPQTGDIILETVGATTFFFGDGQTTATLRYRVIAFSVAENWIIGEALQPGTSNAGLRHTYAGAGPYTGAGINSCCRLSTLNNRPDGNYILATRVTPLNGNRSPVSSLVPIVTVPQSASATFFVPAVDPDGDRLRWRLSTTAEAGGDAHPPNISVNPNTGQVTWNNLGLTTASFWTTQIIVEDLDAAGAVKSMTPVDFFLRIANIITQPPVCTVSPPGPFDVTANTPISFTITGTDVDAGATVTLNSGGLPAGAMTSPALPTTGPSGVQATFNWTPTTPGTHQIVFSATDNHGAQHLCPVTITVRESSDLALTKVATPEPVKVTSNLTYSIVVSNNGPSQASAVTVLDTLPAGVTFVSAASSQGSCLEISGVVNCSLGTLASGAGAAVTIVVTADTVGSITNHARVTSSSNDPNLADNEATVISTVEPANEAPIADASASELVAIAPNNVEAIVRLDGSRSSDPDGDPLTYNWFEGATPLASGVFAEVTLGVGLHTIDLVVSDGLATDTDTIEVLVLSPCDAINLLIAKIEETDLGRQNKRPLYASLQNACNAFADGRFRPGVNQLEAFQHKVRAQIAPSDPVAAECFNDLAQQVIDAVGSNF